MALSLEIISEKKLSVINAYGEISLKDISELVNAATLHPKWRADFDVLIDVREAKYLLPYADFVKVPGLLQKLRTANKTKHAFVTGNNFQKAAGELWRPIAKTLGMDFRPFMELQDAYNWLGHTASKK